MTHHTTAAKQTLQSHWGLLLNARPDRRSALQSVLVVAVFALCCPGVFAIDPAETCAPAEDHRAPEPTIERARVLGERLVSFSLSENHATVEVLGARPEEILDLIWGGRSILDSVLFDAVALEAPKATAFILPFDFQSNVPGVLEIRLAGGEVLLRGIPDDSVLEARLRLGSGAEATCTVTSLYAVTTCGGTTSAYTVPYRCCDNNYDGDAKDSGDGNCVWLAWVKARSFGWKIPSTWGNASNWCDKAAATPGWSVSTTAAKNTIACSKTIGHVAWVTSVDNTAKKFTVTEQNCKVEPYCVGTGTQSKTRAFSSAWKFIKCVDTTKCGA
ncbi:MAG: CHAP domain-containing protein [Thermoanaerobaculia bacterium]|nr:CHAP domain-containing protein [Thermoanaerobaculia bacterium]